MHAHFLDATLPLKKGGFFQQFFDLDQVWVCMQLKRMRKLSKSWVCIQWNGLFAGFMTDINESLYLWVKRVGFAQQGIGFVAEALILKIGSKDSFTPLR